MRSSRRALWWVVLLASGAIGAEQVALERRFDLQEAAEQGLLERGFDLQEVAEQGLLERGFDLQEVAELEAHPNHQWGGWKYQYL